MARMAEDTTDTRVIEDGLVGLSSAEVAERLADGRVNSDTDVKTKSVGRILADHTFTFFNAVNLAMFVLVAITQQWRNALFMGVVLSNIAIGVFQEIRAKRMVDKLTILTQRPVSVIRDGVRVEVCSAELVVDDLIRLAHGDQVPADSVVVSGSVTMNESLLTGESAPVAKEPGSELLSGSFVDSGSLVAKVTRVGREGYAARINAEAKYVKPIKSEIRGTLDAIIHVATIGLVPLGLGLFLRTLLTSGSTVNDAILAAVAAVIGMIPQGLVLLTSSVLAIATTRLAMRKVLVQQAYCVETLARVDTLCLDKTGTITTGGMEVARVTGPRLESDGGVATAALATIAHASADDANDTARALLAYVAKEGVAGKPVSRVIPFSSARKYSGCVTSSGNALVMGAAQFVLGGGAEKVSGLLESFDELERVLVVCEVDGFADDLGIVGEPRLLGFVAIRDQIRETAPETMRFFVEQGVELRVISGDDPRTVSAIAMKVGVPGAERYVDASTLDTGEKLVEAARTYRVFGRVTPQQKRELVKALHAEGRTVAMTGDGVNDVLALREADCSVSMSSGSAAARNVSEIVLADNDFAHMPEVVAEGRRSINNLQRSASLFLVKTVYTAALALICIVMPPYPFIPIQMSLLSGAIIGIPSFVLALEPNHDRVRGVFLANVLSRSLPASLSIVVSLFVALIAGRVLGFSFEENSTVCLILNFVVGFLLVWKISQPITPLRAALLVFMVAFVATGCTVLADFYRVAPLTTTMGVLIVVLGFVSALVFDRAFSWSLSHYEHSRTFLGIVSRLEDLT